jgi:hypothetical protein
MNDEPTSARDEIDLGDGHRIVFSSYQGEPRAGANVVHPPVDGKCSGEGWISFEGRSWARSFSPGQIATWNVEVDEGARFTISPSILCRACGDHGFIREGRWVRA